MKKCLKCGEKSDGFCCATCVNKTLGITDLVNNPSHYNQGKIEVADFIADQKMDYFEGNCCKYLCRYKYKNGVEDLRKCQRYINYLIKREEGKTEYPKDFPKITLTNN